MSFDNHTEVAIGFQKGCICADTLDTQQDSCCWPSPEAIDCEPADHIAGVLGLSFASNPSLLAAVALEGIRLVHEQIGDNPALVERIRDRVEHLPHKKWHPSEEDSLAQPRAHYDAELTDAVFDVALAQRDFHELRLAADNAYLALADAEGKRYGYRTLEEGEQKYKAASEDYARKSRAFKDAHLRLSDKVKRLPYGARGEAYDFCFGGEEMLLKHGDAQ